MMLVHAARRNARPEALRSRFSCEQLHLPWLCPAHNAIHRDRRRWVSVDAAPQMFGFRQRRKSTDASSVPSRRALATAVSYRPDDDIPFERLPQMGSMPPPPPPRMGDSPSDIGTLPDLRDLNPVTTLQLRAGLLSSPQRYRMVKLGFGGNLSEIESVFDACLQIGRIERAGNILKRIASLTQMCPEDLLILHNRYLLSAVDQIMNNPSQSATQSLHKWFELEIRAKGIPQNTYTVALMVKASLQSPKGRRERLVRRYMDMIEDEQAASDLLHSAVLMPYEVHEVTHIYPKYNFSTELLEELENEEEDETTVVSQNQPNSDPSVPDVRETGQKGLGLKTLKKSLSLFSRLPDRGFDIANASPEMRRNIQAQLEEDAVSSAIDRWREESAHLTKMGLNAQLQTKSLGARMWKWQLALEEHLKAELVKVDAAEVAEKKDSKDQERCLYGPFLRILPVEKLAAITILSCMSTLGSMGVDKGITLSSAIMAIASSVEDESTYEGLLRNRRKKIWPRSKKAAGNVLTPELIKRATKGRGPGSVSRFASQYLVIDDSNSSPVERQWPTSLKAKVGAFLMSALIEVAKVPVTLTHPETQELLTQLQPAFSHSHQYRMGKKLGVIIANKALVAQLKREPVHSLLAKHLPMLVEPEPWTCFNKGGFITHPAKIMRVKHGDKDQRYYAEAAIGQGGMDQTFKGLDVLGKTSWRINQPIFDIMLEAWNSGEGIANIPPETPKLTMPPEPKSSNDPLDRRRWIRAVKNVENLRSGLHSQRCFQNFQLEIARALRNEVFYFPHNIDFRGRAYPIPPYLNHMGADHCRGLLVFGEGKELGESGIRWLKIQLANVFGFDKASLSEREEFTTKHMADIYDSASKPLAGNRWWLKAEDPWQCLAACIELRNAIESGDPTHFVSHLPIHQDGTCNGLQHYAALGGDSWGARQVNLEPGDRPADVYTAVAELVKESIAQDKEKGNVFAAILDGKITRKTVKQTVMTNVYGVTFVGAKAQVRKQLVAAHSNLPNTDKMNPGLLSSYIATKIFTALSTMFRGAHDIQYWLGECASRISTSLTAEQIKRLSAEWPRLVSRTKQVKSDRNYTPQPLDDLVQFKSSVIWTNPLHMPVVQPYRNSKSKQINTYMQKLNLSDPHRSDPISKRKQLQGFPPNFIHSLDATHMLLSALRCDELGLSFAAVHDSFWTHAKDVETMNNVLRDTFIRIHSEDVIGRLAAEFAARYKDGMYLAKIRTKSLLHEKIQAWRESLPEDEQRKHLRLPKASKAPRLNELMLEYERMKLLRSSDPQEVEKGRKMVTPGSLFEEVASETDLATDPELEALGLGDISPREAQLSADQEISVGDPVNIEEINNPLLGGMGPEPTMDVDGQNILDENQEVDENPVESEEEPGAFEKNLTRKRVRHEKFDVIWLPMSFPPVPKKGEFDVSRLRDSDYFFS